MKNTNLEKKPLVERYGKDLRSVGIVTALGVALLVPPIAGTKYAGQKIRKDISQIMRGLTNKNDVAEDIKGSEKMTAVCDGTYVYHGRNYLE